MKIISRDSKVLSISHNDLDGSVCQIILGNVFKNITYVDTSYYKIDSILQNLNYGDYDHVFLTDISPEKKENLLISDKIILLDHHESAKEYNDPRKMNYVVCGKCASVLTKKFVEIYFNIKLSHLDDLVRLCNDYDEWELKFPESKLLNDLMFYFYRSSKFIKEFFDGRTTFTDEEKSWLKKREEVFSHIYENLNVFEFDKINGCIAEAEEFINEICDKLMNEEKYQIVVIRNPKNGRISFRHRIENLDIGGILKDMKIGGGHEKAAGAFITNDSEFKEKIEKVEDVIHWFMENNKKK